MARSSLWPGPSNPGRRQMFLWQVRIHPVNTQYERSGLMSITQGCRLCSFWRVCKRALLRAHKYQCCLGPFRTFGQLRGTHQQQLSWDCCIAEEREQEGGPGYQALALGDERPGY